MSEDSSVQLTHQPARASQAARIAAPAARRVRQLAAVRAELSSDPERAVASLLANPAAQVADDSAALPRAWPEFAKTLPQPCRTCGQAR